MPINFCFYKISILSPYFLLAALGENLPGPYRGGSMRTYRDRIMWEICRNQLCIVMLSRAKSATGAPLNC